MLHLARGDFITFQGISKTCWWGIGIKYGPAGLLCGVVNPICTSVRTIRVKIISDIQFISVHKKFLFEIEESRFKIFVCFPIFQGEGRGQADITIIEDFGLAKKEVSRFLIIKGSYEE